VIITIFDRVRTALDLASDAGLDGRVEVWDIQQFLSANIYEHSLFDEANRNSTIADIGISITRSSLRRKPIQAFALNLKGDWR
jgi:predicted nicotinamide N-methyase